MKHIRLAPAGNEEKGYFWRLYQQAMRGHIETQWGWDDSWQRQDFAKRWQNNDNLLLVSGRLNLGYAQVSRDSERGLYVTMLIIAPQWRNKGIGRKVLLSLLQAYQARQLELRVFRCNQQALQFYVSAGFRISAEDPEFYSLQGRAEELQAAQPAARRA
ncbi:GNAT family N-acetyltransferase [Bowmanella pacifica]|uniref:N-acetyltransferase domain-containing protein n=1 Tax=Bowmanella pacifica TaxID=502051 RepID=A0A917YZX6_9ALTE|nr:GNAT family N-acetyltransferase [Bowmanella pacifica]GGO71159.1 hypothetical protein GCM10010982_26310 [Bowmanella pacifica]